MAQGTEGLGMPPGTVGLVLLVLGTVGLPSTTQVYIADRLPHGMVVLTVIYSVTGAGIGCKFETVTVSETCLATSSCSTNQSAQVAYQDCIRRMLQSLETIGKMFVFSV